METNFWTHRLNTQRLNCFSSFTMQIFFLDTDFELESKLIAAHHVKYIYIFIKYIYKIYKYKYILTFIARFFLFFKYSNGSSFLYRIFIYSLKTADNLRNNENFGERMSSIKVRWK